MPNERLPLLPLILDGVPPALRQALAQEGIAAEDRRPGPPQGRFLLYDSRAGRHEPPGAGQVGIDVHILRKDFHEDPFEALLDERSGRFRWEIAGLAVTEEVARVDKRAVRERLMSRLRAAVEKGGGVWLRLSAFPFPYRSAFCFRIDYDDYDPHDFDATLAAIAGHEQATSHFVSGAACEQAPGAVARLRGLDVGSHGYWHHTYRTVEENLANVGRGIETLLAAGIEPSGFVAPHGRFNRRLLVALETLGVTHSSEFGLAYDELPFLVAGTNLLEIPIHPLCLGLFLEAASRGGAESPLAAERDRKAAADLAAEYLSGLVRSRYYRGEPALLYGHPTGRLGRYPHVLRQVFGAAASFGAMWRASLSEIHRWWRARAQLRLAVMRHGDQYVLLVQRAAPGFRVGIEYCRSERVALMPLDCQVVRFSPQALAYENRQRCEPVRPVRIDRAEGLRGRVRRLIDWERVTPIDEIATGNWRNWAKRTLRRLWDD